MPPFYQPKAFSPANSIGYLLRRANKLSMARAEAAFAGNEITFTQWIVLALVSNGTAATCAELSRNIGYSSGAMTRLIDQLEARDLLVRRRDEMDRRVTRLALTAAGHVTFTDLAAKVVDRWNEVLEDFDREDITRLIATLNRLVARLEAIEEQGS
ncbi:MarR family winged helix-turn-helix transcriptional regulator [Steroidobacter denitrificans]|uniref:MarR family winged helix-turn-helix transcriptional regulator n=1 Tax=Steroidobacter denitrificans TaxID=465721 RepID=UPI00082CCADD|nr:MarR family transcriptional regulator [Steroidobacter denitrificans]